MANRLAPRLWWMGEDRSQEPRAAPFEPPMGTRVGCIQVQVITHGRDHRGRSNKIVQGPLAGPFSQTW